MAESGELGEQVWGLLVGVGKASGGPESLSSWLEPWEQVGGWAGPGLSGPRPRPGDGLKESEEARLWAAGLTAVSPSDPRKPEALAHLPPSRSAAPRGEER